MPAAPGPGPVVGAHRLLIATAFAAAIVFTLYSVRGFVTTGDPASAAMIVAALVVTIGLGWYLRSLRDLAAKLTPRDPNRV